jgi:deoxycytidylate deaminase
VIHAEINALRAVRPGECLFLAVTLLPCRHCMTFIASKAVAKIVFREIYHRDQMAFELAKEFGIKLVQMPRKAPVKKRHALPAASSGRLTNPGRPDRAPAR